MTQERKNYVIAFYPINKFDRHEFDYCETDEIMKKLATIKDDVILAQLNGTRDIVEDFVDCFNDGEVFEFISDPVVEYLWRLEKALEWLYNRMCTENYKNTEDFLVRTTQDIAFAM